MEKSNPAAASSEFTEPASSFIDLNGIRMHALDWGGEGAPIVILHATGFLGRIYRPLAEPLRAIGHVYSYDQRGHGDSAAAPGGDYSWDATMRDLEAVYNGHGMDRRPGRGPFRRRDGDRRACLRAPGPDLTRGSWSSR